MPTISQLVRKGRSVIEKKSNSPALKENPQKGGMYRVYTTTPSQTPLCGRSRVWLTNSIEVTAYIPVQQFTRALCGT